MPYLESWHEKYHDKQFTIIGVHAPEFDFERDPDNVRWAIEHYGIKYPVVLDNHFKIWHAYANAYWPRKYMVLNGKIVYDHVGEGDYRKTETELRDILKGINPGLDLSNIPIVEEPSTICQTPTPETYCGYSRGDTNNPGGLRPMEVIDYKDSGDYTNPGIYLEGRWRADRQYLEHVGANPSDYLVLPFSAVSANLVVTRRSAEPVTLTVEFNGSSLTDADRGNDVVGSNVTVDEPRMYNLFRADEFTSGILRLRNLPDGLRLYAFSFGGCIGLV